METKKCLITGANGFIGSHLVTALKDAGHTVINIPHENLAYAPDRLELITKDIDWIFHLAAAGNMYGKHDNFDIFSSNLGGTFNLLQATKDIPYKTFVNVSSSSVLLPHQTMYSATKLGAEAMCCAFADEYKKPIISMRPFSVYGVGEASFRFIPTVFRSCMIDEPMTLAPDSVHDWVYIDDIITTLIDCAKGIEMSELFSSGLFSAVDCGTGIATTNQQVVDFIEGITGKKANIIKRDELRSFDNDNWAATDIETEFIQLKEGLQKYYESIKG